MEEDFFAPVEAEPGSAGAEITANLAKNFFGVDVNKLPAQKPDGTDVIPGEVPSSIPRGEAAVTTGQKTEAATNPIENGVATVSDEEEGTSTANPAKHLQNIIQNPLEDFVSFSPLWTLAVLTPEQFNQPSSYRTDDLSMGADFDMDMQSGEIINAKQIIFSSAGRGDEFRTNTVNGAPEYYIEELEMITVMAPTERAGNTNAINFTFKIIEPLSMGLLLESMQAAAINAGYTDYLTAPYVLRLDIKGWNDKGQALSSVNSKYFVLKFTKVNFEVDASGSTYTVHAVPLNHDGFSDTINTLYKDVSLTLGKEGTVEELLVSGEKSLCSFLNENEKLLVEQGKIGIPDVYEIQFPEVPEEFFSTEKTPRDAGATKDVSESGTGTKVTGTAVGGDSQTGSTGQFGKNPIGQANFGFTQTSSGIFPFKLEGDVIDENGKVIRDKMVIDSNKRTFLFSQSMSLTNIINQIVVSSSYAKDTVSKPKIGPDGMITWFRIDVQMEFLGFDDVVGDYARKIIYRVVPYKVHHTVFSNPTSAPIGYATIAKKISKRYQYIYTGQNTDVLNFNIQINNLFYIGANPSAEASNATINNPDQNGVGPAPGKTTPAGKGAAPAAQATQTGRARVKRDPSLLKNKLIGGSGDKTTEQMVAEAFHQAFIKGTSADLVKIDLEILGDPYWLSDSGISNYFASTGPTDMVTADGTVNYEQGDVFIYITFRVPSDIDEKTGFYQFSKFQKESPFTGIYRVNKCRNTFAQGTWTQVLECVRMPGPQDEALPVDPGNALAVTVGLPIPIKSSPIDSKYQFTDEEAEALFAEFDAAFPTGPSPTETEQQDLESIWDDNLGEFVETGRVWDDNLGDYI